MRITLELSPAVEGQLRESVAQRDADAVHRLLMEVLASTVETLLQEMPAELPAAEFEATADQLADALTVDMQNDSFVIAHMREQRLTKLATANGDFDRINGITVYKPADLEEDNTQ